MCTSQDNIEIDSIAYNSSIMFSIIRFESL